MAVFRVIHLNLVPGLKTYWISSKLSSFSCKWIIFTFLKKKNHLWLINEVTWPITWLHNIWKNLLLFGKHPTKNISFAEICPYLVYKVNIMSICPYLVYKVNIMSICPYLVYKVNIMSICPYLVYKVNIMSIWSCSKTSRWKGEHNISSSSLSVSHLKIWFIGNHSTFLRTVFGNRSHNISITS